MIIESEEKLRVELKKLLARTHRKIRDESIIEIVAQILVEFASTRAGIGQPGGGNR